MKWLLDMKIKFQVKFQEITAIALIHCLSVSVMTLHDSTSKNEYSLLTMKFTHICNMAPFNFTKWHQIDVFISTDVLRGIDPTNA